MAQHENRLLILSRDTPDYFELMRQADLPRLQIFLAETLEAASAHAAKCNILLGEPGLIAELLPHAAKIDWVQSTWAGVNPLLAPGLRRDYLLTGVKGLFGAQMAEYVFCYLLMYERRALARYQSQQTHQWDRRAFGRLREKTLGLLGVGSIGAEIARVGKCFGMRTLGFTRAREDCRHIDAYFHGDRLPEFLAAADYVVCSLPETRATQGLLDEKMLACLQPHALFVNIGRGAVVDEQALIAALQAGRLAGAVLDVFQQEPLPPESPLWDLPNVYITSHTAAISAPQDVAPIFIENYRRFVAGKPLKYVIDFARGY